MADILKEVHPVMQAFLAASAAWVGNSIGTLGVYLRREIGRKALDGMLGFAGGVMISASFWSLLLPAIEIKAGGGLPAWLPALAGFVLGGIFLRITDAILPHLHFNLPTDDAEGISTSWKKTTLLVFAVSLHNIPEGLALGVAFGAAGSGVSSVSTSGAMAFALGLALHNLPEGAAVSLSLRREGLSRSRSFLYGQLSGAVEIVSCVLGALAVTAVAPVLPYAMGFAAGAMIFVVVEELIPESQRRGNTDIATMGAMAGFALMMVLAVGFR